MFRNKLFRWILLTLGLLAIIALTGMNVYSLYDIRDKMVEGEEERQIAILDDMVDVIRERFYYPFRPIGGFEKDPIEKSVEQYGKFPPLMRETLIQASDDPLFTEIFYTPEGTDPCQEGSRIYKFNKSRETLDFTDDYPSSVCDGVGLARTKARIELNNYDFQFSSNVEFDAHRTMNIGLINTKENRIIGYLTATLDTDYIINGMIGPMLEDYFNSENYPGTVLWLHDWPNNRVLATNNPSVEYERGMEDTRRSFIYGNMMDNWNIKIAFLDNPVASAYNGTLFKNLFVLGIAVLFVMGALLFMFYTAQQERNLYQRQAGFLANVTHELKTPLAVMQAAGENISDGRVTEPDRLKQYGNHIYNESIRLRGMIEKLLDVAKTDSGQTLIKAIPANLNELVKEYLNENREYIKNKGFDINLKLSDTQSLIMIDPDNLETILSNLTENAIKYSTDTKKITFEVLSSESYMFLNVEDAGIGIPRKHQKNIFKKFYRIEDSLNARTKGHGLGLSIVQSLTELNGGTISVSSEVGNGTIFTLKFPIFVREDDTYRAENGSPSPTKNVTDSEYA